MQCRLQEKSLLKSMKKIVIFHKFRHKYCQVIIFKSQPNLLSPVSVTIFDQYNSILIRKSYFGREKYLFTNSLYKKN